MESFELEKSTNNIYICVCVIENKSGCRTKVKELFTHSWDEKRWVHAISKDIRAKWNVKTIVQLVESVSHDYKCYVTPANN